MGETFLININCSKILSDKDETQYTMFIDTTKMSIVYELVEWIRWVFSVESCIYLTYDNSVIHELEDIHLLSNLKNFEVKPCGGPQCVHKKMYRTLLKNLNLFVNWNGTEVHRYFLHKLSRMDQKLSQKNGETSPKNFKNNKENVTDFKTTVTESPKNSSPMNNASSFESKSLDTSQNEVPYKKSKSFYNTEVRHDHISPTSADSLKKNIKDFLQSNYYGCKNSCSPTVSEPLHTSPTVINNSPEQNKPNTIQPKQSETKSFKKYVKPFSLGEILSNIREDFEKQNIGEQKSAPVSNVSMFEEGNFDEALTVLRNSFLSEDETIAGKKRKRIRKRKKAKKQQEVDSVLHDSKNDSSQYSFDFIKTNTYQKPNHIRFDIENEDAVIETECSEAELKNRNENEFGESKMKDNLYSSFTKKEPQKLTLTNYNDSGLSDRSQSIVTHCITNEAEFSAIENQAIPEDKLIDLDDEVPDNINQGVSGSKSNRSPDLTTVFSLKDKFKNGVVIERFY